MENSKNRIETAVTFLDEWIYFNFMRFSWNESSTRALSLVIE